MFEALAGDVEDPVEFKPGELSASRGEERLAKRWHG